MIFGVSEVDFRLLELTFGLWDVIFGCRKRDVGYGLWFVGSWAPFFRFGVAKMSDGCFSCGRPGSPEGVGGG